jgi:hypothetical protein
VPLHGGPLLGALVEVGAGGVAAHGSRARCAPAVMPACCSDWREAWNPGWIGERPAGSYGRAPRASFRYLMTLLPSRSPTGTAGPVVKNGRLVLVVLTKLRPLAPPVWGGRAVDAISQWPLPGLHFQLRCPWLAKGPHSRGFRRWELSWRLVKAEFPREALAGEREFDDAQRPSPAESSGDEAESVCSASCGSLRARVWFASSSRRTQVDADPDEAPVRRQLR